MEKAKKIKEIFESIYVFTSLYNSVDPDWSRAADKFIAWNIHKDFKTESFVSFVDWIDDDNINNTWHFFFGYGDDFKRLTMLGTSSTVMAVILKNSLKIG